jgi:hypothetical protein
LTSLNLGNNNLGDLVLPEGWTQQVNSAKTDYEYKHIDGTVLEAKPGKPEGVIAIANAIKNMGALSFLNVKGKRSLGKAIQESNVQFLVCDEWSITQDTTELDVSGKNLQAADATLLAGVISNNGAISRVNLEENQIQFSNELCVTLLRCAIGGLRIQVLEGNDFSAVNKHTMEFVLLEMFGKKDIPTEVNVESAGLTGTARLLSSLPPLLEILRV